MIQFLCINCQAKFSVSDSKAGHRGRCPKCGAAIEVPSTAATASMNEGPSVAVKPAENRLGPHVESDNGEIPLADEPLKKEEQAPARQQAPPSRARGLVIMPLEDITIVDFQDQRILDAPVIETIGRELYALVDEQAIRKIVLNFSKVQFLSSQMLGVLITLQKKSAGIKGRVVLCGVRSDLQKVFTIMKLERLLPIVADEQTAMALLGFRRSG
jgi:anti-sigma B factor antagonist